VVLTPRLRSRAAIARGVAFGPVLDKLLYTGETFTYKDNALSDGVVVQSKAAGKNQQGRVEMNDLETRDWRRSAQHSVTARGRDFARRSLFHTLLAGVIALALGMSVHAVEAPTNSTATGNSSAPALDEIVVTALKRSEPLSKAPLAVSALSQDELTTAGVVVLQDLTSSVPSVEMRQVAFDDSIQVTIRGITNTDFNPGGSPAVATYVDGIYLARTQGLNGDLFDLDRVEVLRGPQGTLYGRNSTGGSINVVSADPRNTFGASVDLTYGNYNDVQTRGMVNIPITDELAIRGAFSVRRSDGYFNTEGSTSTNYGAADNYAGRLTALWTPSSDFKWRLALEDSITGGTPVLEIATAPNGRPIDGLPVFDRPVPSSPEPSNYVRNFTVRSRMEWQLASNISVSYLAGYEDLKYSSLWALAGSDPALVEGSLADGHRTGGDQSYSQEIDLNFEWNSLKNILGANYLYESERDFDDYHFYTLALNYRGGTSLGPTATDESWGIFDQATYTLVEGLRLTAGVRYSSENKGNSLNGFGQEYCAVNVSLNTALSQMYTPGCSFSSEAPVHGSWSNTNWKAGLEYDLTNAILTYASVTTGFKAGGLNIGGNITPVAYAPEKVTSYELGLKGHFFDNRVSIYADGFDMDYTDLQVTQLSGVANITNNAAKASIYGTEIEGQWLMTPKDRLNGFFDYLHATYSNYRNAVDQQTGIVYPSLSGNTLAFAPRYSARLSYAHEFDLTNGGTITPSGAVYYQSVSYLREFDLPIDAVQAYTKSSVNIEYADPTHHWNVDGYVNNLENSVIRTGGATAVGLYWSSYEPPRTYGVRIAYKY
jgi:iron complex outermembrane receptor protein